MRECQNCGNPLPDLATFCNQCWQTVDAEGGATADPTLVTAPRHGEGGGGDAPTQPADPGASAPRFEAPPPLPTATPPWAAPGGTPGGPWSTPGSAPPPPPPWGPPAGAYGPGYGPPPYRPPASGTNAMAIASLVCSIAGLVSCGLGSVLGVIFGHIGLSQIKRNGGTQPGRGLAIAGLVIGYLLMALWVAFIVISVAVDSGSSTNDF